MRILVVEDDALLGDALQSGLRQRGFDVDWVRDGVAGDGALASEPFAAVVLDIGLPRLDGLTLLGKLRKTGLFFDEREIQLLFPAMQIRKTAEKMVLVNGLGTGGTTTLATVPRRYSVRR